MSHARATTRIGIALLAGVVLVVLGITIGRGDRSADDVPREALSPARDAAAASTSRELDVGASSFDAAQNAGMPKESLIGSEATAPRAAFEVVADLRYRVVDDHGVGLAAVHAARAVFDGHPDGVDFSTSEAVRVRAGTDECFGAPFRLVELQDASGGYTGSVVLEGAVPGTVDVGVIEPSPWSVPSNQTGSAPPPSPFLTIEAIAALVEATPAAATLVRPCAGSVPLGPVSDPYYAFDFDGERVLVHVRTGNIITPADIEQFQNAAERIVPVDPEAE